MRFCQFFPEREDFIKKRRTFRELFPNGKFLSQKFMAFRHNRCTDYNEKYYIVYTFLWGSPYARLCTLSASRPITYG